MKTDKNFEKAVSEKSDLCLRTSKSIILRDVVAIVHYKDRDKQTWKEKEKFRNMWKKFLNVMCPKFVSKDLQNAKTPDPLLIT